MKQGAGWRRGCSGDQPLTELTIAKKAKPPAAVLEVKDDEEGVRRVSLDKYGMPGQGEDDLLALLAEQVIAATKVNDRTPEQTTDRYNAAIAAFHDIAPVGALEGMLAAQMIAAHMATMDCYAYLTKTGERPTHEYHLNQVNKLSRTYVALLDALNRHRGKTGQQKVTVEHVHVHQGGQAIVGHVEHPGGGDQAKSNGSTPCVNG
jgi:hypothetical protein